MKIFFTLLALCILSSNPAFGNSSFPKTTAGLITYALIDEETGQTLDMAVWFPSATVRSGINVEGWHMPAHMSRRVTPGFYPIVLLSHDTVGGRFFHNDLAAFLAEMGNIVITPTHIGDNYADSKNIYSAELLYSRPRHLLLALEKVLASKELAPYADESRIAVVGVGFGSLTALQLAGAKPDFSRLEAFCANNAGDTFCQPWIFEKMQGSIEQMLNSGKDMSLLTPSLDLYAPEIVQIDMSYFEAEAVAEEPQVSRKTEMKDVLLSMLGKSTEQPHLEPVEEDLTPTFPDGMPAEYIYDKNFQVAGVYGAIGKTGKILVSPGPVDAYFGEKIATKELAIIAAMHRFKGRKHEFVFFRPASQRKILTAVLIAPAGGMLFSTESLKDIDVPVGIVDLPAGELYPSVNHAKSLFTSLPLPPEVLVLEGTDHYSVFAPCSKDMLELFPQACGKINGSKRDELAKTRNFFVGDFLRSSLGGVLPVPAESGFIDSSALGVTLK